MARQKKTELTEQDVQAAIENAKGSLKARRDYDEKFQPRGFSKWGNDKCISRTKDAIEEMQDGVASERRVRWWRG